MIGLCSGERERFPTTSNVGTADTDPCSPDSGPTESHGPDRRRDAGTGQEKRDSHTQTRRYGAGSSRETSEERAVVGPRLHRLEQRDHVVEVDLAVPFVVVGVPVRLHAVQEQVSEQHGHVVVVQLLVAVESLKLRVYQDLPPMECRAPLRGRGPRRGGHGTGRHARTRRQTARHRRRLAGRRQYGVCRLWTLRVRRGPHRHGERVTQRTRALLPPVPRRGRPNVRVAPAQDARLRTPKVVPTAQPLPVVLAVRGQGVSEGVPDTRAGWSRRDGTAVPEDRARRLCRPLGACAGSVPGPEGD